MFCSGVGINLVRLCHKMLMVSFFLEKSKDFEKDPKSPTASPETVAPGKQSGY